MSHAKNQSSLDSTKTKNISLMPNGKAAAAAPKVSDDSNVELNDMGASNDATPERDIMHLARLGDIKGIESLYESGRFDASYCDEEGITPLHWAAINNQYATCQFLIKAGVDVNKKGGESVATPAMWAAQRCHYYTVHLLLENGADPLVSDIQGYNILHLATFEGNLFLLVLLLHQGIPVDIADSHGHTCLMWASYKGFPACVDLFLRWGADVHATDETGFTALHWALVKGSGGCIQKLIEYGVDRFAKTVNGKTPAITAEEMKTERIWHKALRESGYNEDGQPRNLEFPLSTWLMRDKRLFMTRFFFLWPAVILWVMIMLLSHMVIYAAIPFALLAGYGLQWLAMQVMDYAPSDMRHLHKTPWLAGIFAGTLWWVAVRYLTHVLPATFSDHALGNLAFIICASSCAYFYTCTMIFEPGYVPKLGGLTQQKAVVNELIGLWQFDEHNFCVPCMIRMPLRSKHCKRCNRCVAKHDHHCPWVYNCVAVNNHRHFFLYLISLEAGISILVQLAISYFEDIKDEGSNDCSLLAPELCKVVNADPFTLVLMFWAALQLTWVTMLLFVQFVQIARAMTTWENMKGAHHGGGSKASDAITNALVTGSTSLEGAQLGNTGLGPDPALPPTHAPRHGHQHKAGCFAQWKRILGVDTFVETAVSGLDSKTNRRRNRNPFSTGVVGNCKDFWCDSAPVFGRRLNGRAMFNGQVVDYTSMYETPRMMRARAGRDGARYESVAGDDEGV